MNYNNREITKINPNAERTIPFKHDNFEYIKNAMVKVLKPGGTGHRIGAGLSYTMGGKTGTAQVVQIQQGKSYNAAALREQHRDHAWFISFAPVDKPEIAIAVLLENGGWGANAAPLARSLTDFYMLNMKQNQFPPESETWVKQATVGVQKAKPVPPSIFQTAYAQSVNPQPTKEAHHD